MDNINLKGFTAIDNSILFDSNLSDNAFRFLMKIRHILTTKQQSFNPCKAWILKVCDITKSMYEKVMKELKEFIELVKVRKGSKYEYTYKLLKDIFTPVEKASKECNKEPKKQLEGQQSIDDIGFDIDEYKGIKKQYKRTIKSKAPKQLRFSNYEQRDVNYDEIEDELLGWHDLEPIEIVAERVNKSLSR